MAQLSMILKEVRAKKGWSQEAVARRLGTSLSTIQRWEKDRCKPSRLLRRELEKLFREIGITERPD